MKKHFRIYVRGEFVGIHTVSKTDLFSKFKWHSRSQAWISLNSIIRLQSI